MKALATLTVAVVDDHDKMRNSLSDMLAMIGFNVIIKASNGKDFLFQMRSAASVPDLCILDINMPVMNGVQTASCAKTLWPGMKILAHTFDSDDTDAMQKSGIDGFLRKGCSMSELKEKLLDLNYAECLTAKLVERSKA